MPSGAADPRRLVSAAAERSLDSTAASDWRASVRRIPLARLGACTFVLAVGLPSRADVGSIVLVICAVLATLVSSTRQAPPLRALVMAFLASTCVSALFAAQPGLALTSTAALLPGCLLFFLIAERFESMDDLRALFLSFAVLALSLSAWLLWNAWLDGPVSPNVWAAHAATPLVVVGNDVTFLAVIAPLSCAVLCSATRRSVVLICAASLALTACAIALFQSRGALLALTAALAVMAIQLQPRRGLAGLVVLAAASVAVDASLGFPFAAKIASRSAGVDVGRIEMWQAALRTFVEAPWLGRGPYATVFTSADQRVTMRWAHNLYLDVLVGQGIFGFSIVAVLVARGVWLARRAVRHATGEARPLAVGTLAALTGFVVAAAYEASLLRLWSVLSFFALLGAIAHLSAATDRSWRRHGRAP
jgi:O-antigen ligase